MQTIQIFQYKETPMEFEVINGEVFANATAMCQAFNKSPKDFLKTDRMDRYINAISVRTKIPTDKLVEVKQGGTNQGTWIHEKLILKLSQWLSVDFEIWCDEKIAELLRTGRVEVEPRELSRRELALMVIQIEDEKERLEMKVENLSTALDSLVEWISILKVATFNSVHETVFSWHKLKKKSIEMGYEVKKAQSPRFQSQNLYHVNAFRACYPQYNYKFLDSNSQLALN